MIYKAVEVIWIFSADGHTGRVVPRGPRGPKKAPPLKNGQLNGQKRPENARNFFHSSPTYTKFTFCKKNGLNRPFQPAAVVRRI